MHDGDDGNTGILRIENYTLNAITRSRILSMIFDYPYISDANLRLLCGLQLPGEPHWSTRLLQLTDGIKT